MASTYTQHPEGFKAAWKDACEMSAQLIDAGLNIFSPIVHFHAIAVVAKTSEDAWDFWMARDKPLMEAATGIVVCQTTNWEKSKGIALEIEYFRSANKPVLYGDWR